MTLFVVAKKKKSEKVTEEERSEVKEMLKVLSEVEGAKLPKLQRQWSSALI